MNESWSHKKRLTAALEGGKPDRLPIALSMDIPYLCKAAGCDMRDYLFLDNQTRAETMRKSFLRHPANDLLFCQPGIQRSFYEGYKYFRESDKYLLKNISTGKTIELKPGWPESDEPECPNPIADQSDIDRILGPHPTVEDVIDSGIHDPMMILIKSSGKDVFIICRGGNPMERTVYYLGGFIKAMETIAQKPELVAALFKEISIRKAIVNIKAAAKVGAHGVRITACMEGADMISPDHWRKIMLPGHKLLVAEAKKCGLKVFMWFLGDCLPLLNDLAELGLDGLWIEQPRRGYSSDLGQIRKIVGNQMCLFGWLPEIAMFQDNRPEISRIIEQQIGGAGLSGPFVLSTSFMAEDVAGDTVDFLCEEGIRINRRLNG